MRAAAIQRIDRVLAGMVGGGRSRTGAGMVAQRPGLVHYRPDRRPRLGTLGRSQRKAERARRRRTRKAARTARGLSTRVDFIRRGLVDLLRWADDALDLTLDVTFFAKAWRTDPRCIRRHLARWEKMGYLRRVDSCGGRRHWLRLRVTSARFVSLARWLGLPGANPDILPCTPIQSNASSAGLRPVRRSASPMSEKPSTDETRQAWRRLKRIEPGEFQAPARQFRALMRYFRFKCWQRGLSFAASQRLTAALGSEIGSVGKWLKREYLVTAATIWLRGQKPDELESLSFPALRAIAARSFPAPPPAAAPAKPRTAIAGAAKPTAAATQLPLFAAEWLERMMQRAALGQAPRGAGRAFGF